MNQKLDTQQDAFIAPPITIGEFELRPITFSTYRILMRTGNPLVTGTGEEEDEEGEIPIAAIQEFLYIHAEPLADVLEALQSDQFSDAALLFCDQFSLEEINEVSEKIGQAALAISESTAEPKPDESLGKPESPVTNQTG